MAVATNWGTLRNLNKLTNPRWVGRSRACSDRSDDCSTLARKNRRNRTGLVKISTLADGKWGDNWNRQYNFSFRELKMQDLVAEESDRETQVSLSLHIQQHASFGLSVDGKIMASFSAMCHSCSLPYCKKIDTDFNVLILSSNRKYGCGQVTEFGGHDEVIYVKPGYEANLDSLIQDAIRLCVSVKDTCSESCEKTLPQIRYMGEKKEDASVDGRWSTLIKMRKAFPQ